MEKKPKRTDFPWYDNLPALPTPPPAGVSAWTEYAMGKRRLEWVIRLPIARPALLGTWFGLWIHRYVCPLPGKWRKILEEINFKAKWTLKPVGFMGLMIAGAALLITPLIIGGLRRKSA